jgi:hypothetical protein
LILLDYRNFDGGDEEGGSLIGLIESIGRIWWPLIIFILVIYILKSIYSAIFIEGPERRREESDFNKKYPTIQDKQRHYDELFQQRKARTEVEWKGQREEFLRTYEFWIKNSSLPNYPELDIRNLAKYAKHVERQVVKYESSSKGYTLLREWWTYDGEWRQGYWTGKYDYKDILWEVKTKCDFLDETVGDIQPKIQHAHSDNTPKIKTDKETLMAIYRDKERWSKLTEREKKEYLDIASTWKWDAEEFKSFFGNLSPSEISLLWSINDDDLPF